MFINYTFDKLRNGVSVNFFCIFGLLFIAIIFQKNYFVGYFISIFFISFLNSSYSESRGGQILKVIFTNPSIILLDGSVSERLLAVEIGYRSLQMNLIGNGGGSYEKSANQVNDKFNLVNKYEKLGICCGRAKGYLKNTVSSFARYSIELGFSFPFFLVT